MICTRCGGCLRVERVHWRSALSLLACMNCGNRIDARILQNRRRMVMEDQHDWKRALWDRIRTLADAAVTA